MSPLTYVIIGILSCDAIRLLGRYLEATDLLWSDRAVVEARRLLELSQHEE